MKICNLEKDQASVTAHPDPNEREDLWIEEAFLASEIAHLKKAQMNINKDTFKAKLMHYREKPGGVWSKLGKVRRPWDSIFRLKTLNTNPPQFERETKRMAKLAWDYHKNLQNEGISHTNTQKEHENKMHVFLQHIPLEQTVQEPESSPMNWPTKREHV